MASDIGSKLSANLFGSSNQISKSFQKLSSGKRINSASDDAAGLAIVSQLESSVKTSIQGARNAVDGISVASIAEGALSQVTDITSRQQELATQAANGTVSDTQRDSLNQEYQALESEKQRIFSTTSFNGVNVFSGTDTTLQVGQSGDASSQIKLSSISSSALGSVGDISSQANAQAAIDQLKNQGQTLSESRGQIGAAVSRVSIAEQGARNNAVESEGAASRIRDADVAEEAAKLTSAKIRQHTTTALVAQAGKLTADSVLRLLG